MLCSRMKMHDDEISRRDEKKEKETAEQQMYVVGQ